MTGPPVAERETTAPAKDGRSSAQLSSGVSPDRIAPDRMWLHELLRPLLVLRGRWSH